MIATVKSENGTPTARERIREALALRIGEGRLVAGDRIVEADLVREFGVSAIPAREAIRELVATGVLDFAPHRGAWVRRIGMVETIEALEVKAALEALAARRAAAALRSRCGDLRAAVDAIVRSARTRDFVAYQKHNQTFHRTIVEASGNRTLIRIWERLAFDVRTRPIMEFLRREDPVHIAREHRAVFDALRRGAGGEAARLLAGHARRLIDHLEAEMAVAGSVPEPRVSKRTRPAGPRRGAIAKGEKHS